MRRMWLEAWTAPSEPDEDTAPPKGMLRRCFLTPLRRQQLSAQYPRDHLRGECSSCSGSFLPRRLGVVRSARYAQFIDQQCLGWKVSQ